MKSSALWSDDRDECIITIIIIIIIIIIIMKSSVDRDNNYCHYVILRNASFAVYSRNVLSLVVANR
jgi:hypothetical protein